MSFRKSFSSDKKIRVNLKSSATQITHKPIGLFDRIFTRNVPDINSNLEETNIIENTKDSAMYCNHLWNLELELIYTGRVLRQKWDQLNRHNLSLQLTECTRLINKRLVESQSFIESLSLNSDIISSVRDSLDKLIFAHNSFFEWTQNINDCETIDQSNGQMLFVQVEYASRKFIELININVNEDCAERKRKSIDNGSMQRLTSQLDPSYKSRFNEEDREIIEKLKKLEENIDQAPPKPQLAHVNQQSLDEYLNKIEAIVKAEKEPIYEYSEINNTEEVLKKKNIKIENNCIMATSTTNEDFPPVDGEDSANESTPTPIPEKVISRNGFNFFKPQNKDTIVNCRKSMPERDKNMPLPPVPLASKVKLKSPQFSTSFHSEDHHFRKASLSKTERSKISKSIITSFSQRSPLRSPSFLSIISQQTNKSPQTQSPTNSLNTFNEISLKSPASISQTSEEGSCSGRPRHLLMAKHIPNIVSDPNQLLNISDMQDDIDIVSRSLNNSFGTEKVEENKRLSNCSIQTTKSLPANAIESTSNSPQFVTNTNEDGTTYNSEVKSDTEEYFEYFEIDGKKYRRKMKKRTVIEKIKIQKTVYAPLKPDGSGPDLTKFDEDEKEMLTGDVKDSKTMEPCSLREKPSDNDQPVFRRTSEERFRVSRSMFIPFRSNYKRITMGSHNDLNDDQINKTPALLTNYMYRFGQSEFEEPVIDKRLSTQLLDDVQSAWMKTSEFNLPHEKSRTIYFYKNLRQRNKEGNTVHSAFRVTASRTVRMKPNENVINLPQVCDTLSNTVAIKVNGEEDFVDDEESDTCISELDTSLDSQYSTSNRSTDEEKEVESVSSPESTGELEETRSSTSTMDDDEYQDPSVLVPEIPPRSLSPDSCYYSSTHPSYILDDKDQCSFILKESNPIPYLIFDDEAKYGECDIAGGPVDALIVYACDGKEHLLFLGAFLDTYRTFIEPEDLINRLINRYRFFRSLISMEDGDSNKKRSDSGIVEESENVVRMRKKVYNEEEPEKKCIHILSLLLTIIGKLKRDLNERINTQIQLFEQYLYEINEKQWIDAIRNTIKSQKQSMERDDDMVALLNKLSLQPPFQPNLKSPKKETSSPTKSGSMIINKLSILDFSSRDIAEQMTLLDWGKYRDVELFEVLNLKDIANCKLPGVIEYAKHFQNVQYWTQSILLDPEKKTTSDRDKYCWKLLRIMKNLQKLNNFSSMIAILLGIQLLPIKKLFSKKIRSKIMEMDDYMKPTRFLGYKEDLKEAAAPCIPFLGLFYQDIVMLNIANPPYLDFDEITRVSRDSNWSTNNKQHLSTMMDKCGPIVNFWRSFKQYIFLKNCNKDQDKIRYSLRPDEKILQFLNNFQNRFDESTIWQLAKQM